jgi:hypothetical protein
MAVSHSTSNYATADGAYLLTEPFPSHHGNLILVKDSFGEFGL